MKAAALLRRAQAGDRDAVAQLADRHMGAAVNATRGLYVPGFDQDDVDQELRYAVLRAIQVCEPGRPLGPVVAVVARRWLLTLLARERRERRRSNLETAAPVADSDGVFVDVVELQPDLGRLGPEEHLLWREETRRLARGVASLSAMERRSLLGLAVGLTYAEIEGREHEPYFAPRWVDNAAQRARGKLRAAA